MTTAGGGCLRDLPDLPPEPEGASIVGEVQDLFDTTGRAPLGGARVELVGAATFAITDERGRFRFSPVPIGLPLSLAIRRPSTSTELAPVVRLVDVGVAFRENESIDVGVVELGSAGGVRGRVRVRGSPDGREAAGAAILALPTGAHSVADPDGFFALDELPEGTHSVVAILAGHHPSRRGGLRVTGATVLELGDLELDVGESAGEVEVAGFARLVGEDTHAEITVELVGAARVEPVARTRTADDGRWRAVVPEGSYRARFSRPGYRSVELAAIYAGRDGVLGPRVALLPPASSTDGDGDGLEDTVDPDRDNDACLDGDDVFPADPAACEDVDGDGARDGASVDVDGDGLGLDEELLPGRDGWRTDPARADTDGDGLDDRRDLCPLNAEPDLGDRDGDGRGDACDDEPLVASVTPRSAEIGREVVLRGRRLALPDELTLVVFGGDRTAVPHAQSPDELRVLVPEGASAGLLSVRTRAGEGRSSESFLALPREASAGPVVYEVRPTWVVVGQTAEVLGARLDEPRDVRVGDVQADVVSVVVDDAAATPPRVRLTVRPRASTVGRVRVVTVAGVASSAAELAVVEAPTVNAVVPAQARAGDTIEILGRGLGVDRTGGSVRVDLVGAPGLVPERVHDNRLVLVVPAPATSGPVSVRHPAGDVSSAVAVTILPPPPRIDRLTPRVVERGAVVTLDGHGLDQVTQLRFARGRGTVVASAARTSPTRIEVVVPSEADAGPITLDIRAGSALTTPRLSLMRRTAVVADDAVAAGSVAGLALIAGGNVLLMGAGAELREYDAATLARTRTRTLALGVGARMTSLDVAPGGAVAVITTVDETAVRTTRVVDLVTGVVRPSCADVPRAAGRRRSGVFRFDGGAAWAPGVLGATAGTDAVLAVELSSGQCSRIGAVTEPLSLTAVLPISRTPTRLLVLHRSRGVGVLDVASNTYPAPFGAPLVEATSLLRDADGVRVWAAGGPLRVRFDTMSAATPPEAYVEAPRWRTRTYCRRSIAAGGCTRGSAPAGPRRRCWPTRPRGWSPAAWAATSRRRGAPRRTRRPSDTSCPASRAGWCAWTCRSEADVAVSASDVQSRARE